jgi:hypothetical protein
MSGVKGRSGGWNRKPAWQRRLHGGGRADRKPVPLSEAEAARLPDLQAAYDFTKDALAQLRVTPPLTTDALREIRQFTVTLLALDAALSRAEARKPPPHVPSEFDEFEQHKVGKWAGILK